MCLVVLSYFEDQTAPDRSFFATFEHAIGSHRLLLILRSIIHLHFVAFSDGSLLTDWETFVWKDEGS